MDSSMAAGRDTVLLVDFGAGDHGHRGQYNAMLGQLFALRRADFSLKLLCAREPVLCPQIETAPIRFALAALLRGLAGRRTVGFLLRPLPALHGRSLRLRAKRFALRVLRHVRSVEVLTIVPFAIEPELARIASGWIHDLQNWDMTLDPHPAGPSPGSELTEQIRARAADRPVCSAVGRQERAKGFDRFAAMYSDHAELREAMLFAYGGAVAPELKPLAQAFAEAGGCGFDRFVSDQELLALYAASDLIWCVYAPDYDQASGVLGRAMQLGLPVAVRKGSVIESICRNEAHPFIALTDGDSPLTLATAPGRLARDAARQRALRHARLSLERLAAALGVAPVWSLPND